MVVRGTFCSTNTADKISAAQGTYQQQ